MFWPGEGTSLPWTWPRVTGKSPWSPQLKKRQHSPPTLGFTSSDGCHLGVMHLRHSSDLSVMESVLRGLARSVCLVYLDDVQVIGRTVEEHNRNLTRVLERIREAGLRLKPRKCKFSQELVTYLGHVVSARGVETDPEKLKAVRDYPEPTNVKSLRSFLGLASYYRRFVPGFSAVAGPLHSLTKDAPFVWGPDCQNAFERLKKLLTTSPVLVFPDFFRGFILETDASGAGLGAVLAQKQLDGAVRPISYASRSLLKHERNYGITELEALGVVWAVN